MRKIALLSAIFFLFTCVSPIFASRSLVIESYKQTFTNNEEGEVKVIPKDFTDGETILIKGAFSSPDSTNYFGFTKKGDTWVKNSITAVDQFAVKIGEWVGELSVKPDLSDTGFKGSGSYNFKVGFYYYTAGGNLSSVNWSDTKSVNISFDPSPTPVPTLIPMLTLTPTPIPSITATSVPTKSPTSKPNPSITSKPQPTPTIYISPSPKIEKFTGTKTPDITRGIVLGDFAKPTIADLPSPTILPAGKPPGFLPIFGLFLGGGLLLVGSGVVLGIRQMKSRAKS